MVALAAALVVLGAWVVVDHESGGTRIGEGVVVFDLDKNSGKIAHQWVAGEVRG